MNQEKEHAKQFLRKELKHHNFDGVIHYGSHGEKSIELVGLLQKYAKEFTKAELEKARKEIERLRKVDEPYGHFFDRVISDGEDPDRAAMDLGLI